MKTHNFFVAVFFCVFIFCYINAHAQWEKLNVQFPVSHAYFTAFATFQGNIIAGVSDDAGANGFYISSDSGSHWSVIDRSARLDGYGGQTITSITTLGNYIFAGTDGMGVFISTNNGMDWIKLNMGSNSMYVRSLLTNDGSIIAGTADGAYVSADSGATWAKDTAGMLPYSGIYSLTTLGNYIFAGAYIITNGGRDLLYRSSDGGRTWTETDSGLPAMQNADIPGVFAANGVLYYARHDSIGLYVSTDSGAHWMPRNNGLPSYWFSPVLATSGNSIFIGSYVNGLYRSTDSGASWTLIKPETSDSHLESIFANSGRIFIGTPNGIFYSSNSGDSWANANDGIMISISTDFYVKDSLILAGLDLLLAFSKDFADGSILRSTTNGASWMTDTNVLNGSITPITFAAVKENIFAGTEGGVYVSTDNGRDWDTNVSRSEIISIVSNGSDIFAGFNSMLEEFGISRSTDNGESWIAVDSGLPYNISIHHFLAVCNRNVFVTMEDQCCLYRTTNNGNYWTKADSGMPKYSTGGDSVVTSFCVVNDTIVVVVGNTSLYRSTNNGDLWEPVITAGLPANTTVNTLFFHGGVLFAGTGSGVYYSSDGGASWVSGNDGLPPGTSAGAFAADSRYLYMSTYDGIYRTGLSDFGISAVDEKPRVSPSQLFLSQNYPNPFRGRTNIEYRIPDREFVTLNVYDLLGRNVATLARGYQSAGAHGISFNGEDLQNGIYFYRLTAGKNVQTGKMTVMK